MNASASACRNQAPNHLLAKHEAWIESPSSPCRVPNGAANVQLHSRLSTRYPDPLDAYILAVPEVGHGIAVGQHQNPIYVQRESEGLFRPRNQSSAHVAVGFDAATRTVGGDASSVRITTVLQIGESKLAELDPFRVPFSVDQ